MSHDEDYLWDRSGVPDPVVQRLEQVLAPLAHDGRALSRAVPSRRWPWLLAAVVLVAAGIAAALWGGGGPAQLPLRVVGEETALLRESDWLRTAAESRHLELADLGVFEVRPNSRLRVRSLRQERTLLELAEGELRAFVYSNAKPRFFQVETPATRCVDLGCRYTLKVDALGNSFVHVTMGQVAFEGRGREIYVPAGATCRASPAQGAGTPRWVDTADELEGLLDQLDGAAACDTPRVEAADRILEWIGKHGEDRDSLMAWHLLQDGDLQVVARAWAWLGRQHGHPAGLRFSPGKALDRAALQATKQHLMRHW